MRGSVGFGSFCQFRLLSLRAWCRASRGSANARTARLRRVRASRSYTFNRGKSRRRTAAPISTPAPQNDSTAACPHRPPLQRHTPLRHPLSVHCLFYSRPRQLARKIAGAGCRGYCREHAARALPLTRTTLQKRQFVMAITSAGMRECDLFCSGTSGSGTERTACCADNDPSADALHNVLAYLGDSSDPRQVQPAYWAPFAVVGECVGRNEATAAI
jgi:hypothetical protein